MTNIYRKTAYRNSISLFVWEKDGAFSRTNLNGTMLRFNPKQLCSKFDNQFLSLKENSSLTCLYKALYFSADYDGLSPFEIYLELFHV